MDSGNNPPLQLSRQDIIAFPFPYKLWLVVNSETCNFAKWNIDGTEIELEIIALDDYLQSRKSVFEVKNRSSFIKKLENYSFVRTERFVREDSIKIHKKQQSAGISSTYTELVINFKNVNFHRHRIDLLAKIRDIDGKNVDKGNLENLNEKSSTATINRGLCFMSEGAMSGLQMARIKYNTILSVKFEREVLRAKLEASALMALAKGQNNDGDESMIELSADVFENPHDSVLYMADDHRNDYAGFYGDCDNQVICMFFGEFLPMYQPADGSIETEKRIAELNASNPSSQPVDDDVEINNSQPPETKVVPKSPIPLVSSSLQPIFTPEKNFDNAEDISMEDFLTFNENSTSQLNDDSLTPNTFFKQEEDDADNETNFKNFFNQYRESLNLLYAEQ